MRIQKSNFTTYICEHGERTQQRKKLIRYRRNNGAVQSQRAAATAVCFRRAVAGRIYCCFICQNRCYGIMIMMTFCKKNMICGDDVPANTTRWPNFGQTLGRCVVFSGVVYFSSCHIQKVICAVC